MVSRREAAIISAFTGYMLGDFDEYLKYISELMGRKVYTHEIPVLFEEIKSLAYEDFKSIKVEAKPAYKFTEPVEEQLSFWKD